MKMASQICCNQIYPVTASIQKLIIKKKCFAAFKWAGNFYSSTVLHQLELKFKCNWWVMTADSWKNSFEPVSFLIVLFYPVSVLPELSPNFRGLWTIIFSTSLPWNSTEPSVCFIIVLWCLRDNKCKWNLQADVLLFKQVLISIKQQRDLICAGILMAGKSPKVKFYHPNVQMLQSQSLPWILWCSIHCT